MGDGSKCSDIRLEWLVRKEEVTVRQIRWIREKELQAWWKLMLSRSIKTGGATAPLHVTIFDCHGVVGIGCWKFSQGVFAWELRFKRI